MPVCMFLSCVINPYRNMQVRNFFWSFLHFTRVERRGIVLLLALGLVSACLPTVYGYFFKKTPQTCVEPPDAPLFAENTDEHAKRSTFRDADAAAADARLFRFDPNTAEAADLQALGLPQRTIKGILNYRNMGGKFRSPDDFSKIYTLSDEDFERLRPYVAIAGRDDAANGGPQKTAQASAGMASAPLDMRTFDPNTADAATLAGLGLSEKTISGWLNYRSKGGKFRTKDDLKKLYTLSEYDFQRIAPFVQIGAGAEKMEQPAPGNPMAVAASYRTKSVPATLVDLNTAEVEDLVRLPGIGEGWAKRILGWRDKLGGFSTVAQVAEARNLPDSVFQKMRYYVTIAKPETQKISINTATWDQLSKHPYVEAKQARWIVAYREQHGNYRNLEELLRIPELKKDWLERVRPYFAI
jgi:competence protein ComEA